MTPHSDPESLRARLDRTILGEDPCFDSAQVTEQSGVPRETARRIWRALGFPDAGGESAFTPSDIEALRRIGEINEQALDEDTLVRMTRAIGTTMSRLADWEISNLVAGLSGQSTDLDGRLELAIELAERVGPVFEELMLHAWRRHLVAAIARSEALVPEIDGTEIVSTIGFADLVAFTSTTNNLDEDAIGDLVEVFESRCADVVSARRARIIKSLGDSVLFVAETPEQAAHIGWDIIAVIGGDSRLPDVRVGIATGPAVLRMGDVFGPAVNLAARLTTVARRNRVITDDATASQLPEDGFESRPLPARPIRGFGDLEPYAVRRVR